MTDIGKPQKEWQVHPLEWPQEAPHVPEALPQEVETETEPATREG